MAETQATQAANGTGGEEPQGKAPSLAEALLAAQIDMPAVNRDGVNPHFKSKFTTLDNLLSKVRPVLNRHGLVLVQAPDLDAEHGKFVLRTTILHAPSGESMSFEAPLAPPKNDPQGQGSAITYMRRYALAAALAIADQEDDDGNAATAAKAQGLPSERVKRIAGAFKALKLSYNGIDLLLGSCGVDGLSARTPEGVRERIAGLQSVQADALEAALERCAQDAEATAPDADASTEGGDNADV